jgi:hypothetical protein
LQNFSIAAVGAVSILLLIDLQALQESAELKDRLEKERKDLEIKLRQQADIQLERATELEKQVCWSYHF